MKTFALVRDPAFLTRATSDLSDFFAYQWQEQRMAPDHLLGLWVEPHLFDDLPPSLLPNSPGLRSRSSRIVESLGVSGIWTLCWIENPAVMRSTLLDALIDASLRAGAPAGSGRFVPVFRSNAWESEVRADLEVLGGKTALVLPPLSQNPASGRLAGPCWGTVAA
jgi:hypothetical protein